MLKYRVSREAQNDMDEIWDYIAKDNPIAASRVDGIYMISMKSL